MPSLVDTEQAIIATLKADFPDVDWLGDDGFPTNQQQLVSITGLEAVAFNGHPWPLFRWTIELRLYGLEAATELCALVCYWIQHRSFHPEMKPGRVVSVTPVVFGELEAAQTAWVITFTVEGVLTPNDDIRPRFSFGEESPTFPLTLIGADDEVLWGSE